MANLNELFREYEARHYPPTRRLDLQGEGPATARDRVLRWIQMHAHEHPGTELLLVLERGRRTEAARKSPVRLAVEGLLRELTGKLVQWWQPFGPGTIAVRISGDPAMFAPAPPPKQAVGDGRTPETAGAAYLPPEADIPDELLPLARRAAELRRTREGQAVSLLEVVLRGVWIEAQAHAMDERATFEEALRRIVADEEEKAYADDEWG
ncbi:MAG TPA: hypothetical protein VGR37_19790 [Longimicrobiaceae bacterium]|nr:hypothetical protein [Longimicrobiaceae bacterium]